MKIYRSKKRILKSANFKPFKPFNLNRNRKISQTTLQKYQDKLLECKNTTNELNSFNQVIFFFSKLKYSS
jgi:hypothetical protein